MTVVVGFVGDNCAVMASDSQLTTGGMKSTADKIWTAPKGIMLGCATNNWAVKQRLEQGFSQHLSALDGDQLDRATAKAAIEASTQVTLREIYGNHAPMTVVPEHLVTQLLAVGHAPDGYWLFDLGPQGLATERDVRGFHAIGSGFGAAEVVALVLGNYDPRLRSVHHLKLLAHRMITGCIEVLAQAVGGPVQLWSSSDGAPFVKASDDELTELDEAVNVWRGVERESLALSLGEAVAADVELPPDLDDAVAEVIANVAEGLPEAVEGERAADSEPPTTS